MTLRGTSFARRIAGCGSRALLALAWVLMATVTAQAQDLTGDKRIALISVAGERVEIAHVRFEPVGPDRWRFKVSLLDGVFTERFLAMRPFRCIAGPGEQLCHFPHGTQDVVSRADLLPLEYALLFLHTRPGALHVDARNGLFYKLEFTERGLRGRLHDADFDPLIAPRGDGNPRPLTYRQLELADPGAHWLPGMLIE